MGRTDKRRAVAGMKDEYPKTVMDEEGATYFAPMIIRNPAPDAAAPTSPPRSFGFAQVPSCSSRLPACALRYLILTYEAIGKSASIHQKEILSALRELAEYRRAYSDEKKETP